MKFDGRPLACGVDVRRAQRLDIRGPTLPVPSCGMGVEPFCGTLFVGNTVGEMVDQNRLPLGTFSRPFRLRPVQGAGPVGSASAGLGVCLPGRLARTPAIVLAVAVLMLVTHLPVFDPGGVAALNRHGGYVSAGAATGGYRRLWTDPEPWGSPGARRRSRLVP